MRIKPEIRLSRGFPRQKNTHQYQQSPQGLPGSQGFGQQQPSQDGGKDRLQQQGYRRKGSGQMGQGVGDQPLSARRR